MFLMKKNMRLNIEFIFVVRFWVYRTMGGAITIPSFKGLDWMIVPSWRALWLPS